MGVVETGLDTIPERRLDFSRIWEVLSHPSTAFQKIAEVQRSIWQAPMSVLSLTSILSISVGGFFKGTCRIDGYCAIAHGFPILVA